MYILMGVGNVGRRSLNNAILALSKNAKDK